MTRLALVLLLVLPLAARADDASHRAKALELMTLLQAEKNASNVADNIKKQVATAANRTVGAEPTPAQKTMALDVQTKAFKMIDDQIGWPVLKEGFLDIYAKSFTDEQLDAIIAFYKSPAGTALLQKMPEINQQIGQFGSSKVNAMEPGLKQLFNDFQTAVNQARQPVGPALGPVPSPAPSIGPAPANTPTTPPAAPSSPK